jgi:hypothetical protein
MSARTNSPRINSWNPRQSWKVASMTTGMTGKGVFPMIGTQCSNQPNNNASLIAKAMEISRHRKKAKGDDVGLGRDIRLEGERQGGDAKAYNAGEEEADIFF